LDVLINKKLKKINFTHHVHDISIDTNFSEVEEISIVGVV